MTIRHFLSVADLEPGNMCALVDKSLSVAKGQYDEKRPLDKKIVGIYFRGPSTRTRTSFTVGATRLGAQTIHYGPSDLQVSTGESICDTARVLSAYLDALIIRTNESMAEMESLAQQDKMVIINALSENEHPSQIIGDLVTILDVLGHLKGVHVLFVGEGNSTAASLALGVTQIPDMRLTLVSPEGYGLPDSVLKRAQEFAKETGAAIEQHNDVNALPRNVDVVYTTRWLTMGKSKPDAHWREKFDPYRITPALMKRVSKPSGTIFLHDLPAMRGFEVMDEVLDGPQSLVFRQSWHKLNSAMAVLMWCMCAE